jgi:hypothetical protein
MNILFLSLLTQTIVYKQSKISEEKFVSINGIEQWVTIKSESSKPGILFLNGCPGSPISPYAVVIYFLDFANTKTLSCIKEFAKYELPAILNITKYFILF